MRTPRGMASALRGAFGLRDPCLAELAREDVAKSGGDRGDVGGAAEGGTPTVLTPPAGCLDLTFGLPPLNSLNSGPTSRGGSGVPKRPMRCCSAPCTFPRALSEGLCANCKPEACVWHVGTPAPDSDIPRARSLLTRENGEGGESASDVPIDPVGEVDECKTVSSLCGACSDDANVSGCWCCLPEPCPPSMPWPVARHITPLLRGELA